MNEVAALPFVLLAGLALGVLFFGGLWWTVEKGLNSNHPVFWFFGSALLRTGAVVTGFYFLSFGDWRRWLACLLGFFIARVLVTRLTRTSAKGPHAPK